MTETLQRRRRQQFILDALLLALLVGGAILLAWGAYHPPRSITYTMNALPVMLPLDHMHAVEQLPGWSRTFRWTAPQAQLHPANPGGDMVLRLVAGGGTRRTVPTTVCSREVCQQFTVQPIPRTYAMLLPAAPSERVNITVDSPTMEQRSRTLGIMVSDIRLTGSGAAPMTFVVSLAIASMSLFVLLRQVMGNSRNLWGIAALVLVMQVLVLVWQVGGGWRYALAGKALALVSIASVGAVLGQYWVSRRGRIDPLLPPVGKKPGILPTRALLLLLVLALLVRLPWVIAPDPVGDLELAARRMAFLYHDGLAGAYRYNGDYMPLRLYLLWGLSQIVALAGGSFHDPLSPITLAMIKLPGMLADMGIIAIIAGVAYRWQNQNPPSSHPPPPHPSQAAGSIRLPDAHRWFIVAAVYACSPPVWINVAWWGQVDALLVLPLVGMVLLLDHAEGRWSWLLWTVALLIKPQAIVFAPLLYVATIRQHGSRGVAQGMAIATATFALASTPLVMAGQGPGLTQAYLGSVGRFPKVTIGAYNLWYLLTGGQGGDDSTLIPLFSALVSFSYRQVGLMLVGGTALVVGAVVLRRADTPTRAHAAAVLALAFFMLPTQIHERYLFLVLPFLALCIAYNTRFVIPYSILVATATINILGTLDGFVPLAHSWITHAPLPLPMLCAVANLVVFLWLFAWLIRHSGERSYLPDARSSPQTGLDD